MATTTKLAINKNWIKISDSDCTVQSEFAATDKLLFAVSETVPSSESGLLISVSEPVNFAYKTPVWCRTPFNAQPQSLNIIK